MSRHRFRALLIAGLPVVAGAGCDDFSGEEERVVVSVGEREVTQVTLDRFIASRTGLGGTFDAPLLSGLLDEFVREQLLVMAAEEEGVAVSEVQLLAEISALRRGPGTAAVRTQDDGLGLESDGEEAGTPGDDWLRSEVRNRLLVSQLMDTVVLTDLEATEESLQLEFEANRAFYQRPETVTLSERRFDDRASAEAAAQLLRQDPGTGDGGDAPDGFLAIGTFRRGELPDAVDQAVFALTPGNTTDAIETAAGFRVFRVDRKLPAASLEFEEVKDVVRLTVLRQEADARVQALLEELQGRYPVRVHTDNLTFPYVGLLTKVE
jgi:parvulin-like peptidyl-prolyl isomerase